MKCGIVTFHRAVNFGGILQAYALQRAMSKVGICAEIIDYRSPFIENQYHARSLFDLRTIKRIGSALVRNGALTYNTRGFNEFAAKHIRMSQEVYRNQEELLTANDVYDVFVTGSDQVWSYYCAGFDKSYFLDFVTEGRKKNSYAASFGVSEIPRGLQPIYRDLLSDYNRISVREESGRRIVLDLLGREAEVLPDPTLLLDRQEWQALTPEDHSLGRYILVYMIAESKSILDLAIHIARQSGLRVIYVNDRIYGCRGVDNLRRVSPATWITLLMNAECVLTNSFHGISFCLNFHKEFYMQYLETNIKVNNRLQYILQLFGVEDRCVRTEDDLKRVRSLDHAFIDSVLEERRVRAYEYLKGLAEGESTSG